MYFLKFNRNFGIYDVYNLKRFLMKQYYIVFVFLYRIGLNILLQV